MKANSYLMSDSEFSAAVEMIVGGFEKKYNYKLMDVTDMDVDELSEFVKSYDSMIPNEILVEIENFRMNASDDAFVYILRTDSEVCGIISVQD